MRLQQFRYCCNLIGLGVYFGLAKHEVVGGSPGCNHMNSSFTCCPVVRMADGLTVQCNNLPGRSHGQSLHPRGKATLKLGRVNESKNPPERIVGGYAIREAEELLEPRELRLAEQLNIRPRVSSTDNSH